TDMCDASKDYEPDVLGSDRRVTEENARRHLPDLVEFHLRKIIRGRRRDGRAEQTGQQQEPEARGQFHGDAPGTTEPSEQGNAAPLYVLARPEPMVCALRNRFPP